MKLMNMMGPHGSGLYLLEKPALWVGYPGRVQLVKNRPMGTRLPVYVTVMTFNNLNITIWTSCPLVYQVKQSLNVFQLIEQYHLIPNILTINDMDICTYTTCQYNTTSGN